MTLRNLGAFLVAAMLAAPSARADLANYYVGRDANPLQGGAANPNFGNLTFLYNHGDHFHSLGRVGGPGGQLPESYIGGRILLQPGTGAMAGRFVSQAYDDGTVQSEYSNLEMRTIDSLRTSTDPMAPVLLNSSGGRWGSLGLDGALVGLELLSISDGLYLANEDGTGTVGVGEFLTLGAGETFASTPQFFTAEGSPFYALYEATFRLVDLRTSGTPFGSSGTILVSFQAVPEPSTWLLTGVGAAGLLVAARRRRRGPVATS